MGFRDRGVEIKTPDQIAKMRVAGVLTGETLALLRSHVRAGVTTGELDRIAEENIRAGGGVPVVPGVRRAALPRHDLRLRQRRGGPRDPGRPDPAGRRRHLHRLRRHRRRLARRLGDHRGRRRGVGRRPRADAGHRGVHVGRDRRGAPRRPGLRHLPRRRVLRALAAAPVGRPVRHPRGVHRPRHRDRDAPAAQRAQLRPPRAGAQARARAGAGRGTDGDPGQPAQRPGAGRVDRASPRTAAGRRTSSTPSR